MSRKDEKDGQCTARVWNPSISTRWPHMYRCIAAATTIDEDKLPSCEVHKEGA